MEDSIENEPDPIIVPVTSELDLHTFRPSDIGSLIPEYILECRKKGLLQVRIIHGKGTGTLREGVHSVLRKHPEVIRFRMGDETSGSWGATLVTLRPLTAID